MALDKYTLAQEGMHYFGRMSASATHEIKNILAIINESAGLLGDLTQMAETGHPLSVERIRDISQRLTRQVARADLVVKKLNQLSHGLDFSMEPMDLEKTLNFVLEAGSRLVDRLGPSIKIIPSPASLQVTTQRLYLETILWQAIEGACQAAGGEGQVTISFGMESSLPFINFSMDQANPQLMDALLMSEEENALKVHLNLVVEKKNDYKSFRLMWPETP